MSEHPPTEEELENMIKFGAAAMNLAAPNRLPESTQYTFKLEQGSLTLKVDTQIGNTSVELDKSMRVRTVNKKLERDAEELVNDVVGEYVDIPEKKKEKKEESKGVKETILNS